MADQNFGSWIPGLVFLCAGAVTAWFIGNRVPYLTGLLLAIVIGAVVTNLGRIPSYLEEGISKHNLILATGIVLMGVTLDIDQVVESGFTILLLILGVCLFTLLYVELLSRFVFRIVDKLGTLIAAGSSICGVSAIVAVAGTIDARSDHIAYAAATILLFDAVTIIVYPIVGSLLVLPDRVFGIWAGVSMFSTGPVVAVGFSYSDVAGQWATITKVTRNMLIGIIVIGYSVYYARGQTSEFSGFQWIREFWEQFPKFVIGFVLLAVIANVGWMEGDEIQQIEHIYSWLFLLAFVGLGTDIQLNELRSTGIRPLLAVLVGLTTVSSLSLFTVYLLFS